MPQVTVARNPCSTTWDSQSHKQHTKKELVFQTYTDMDAKSTGLLVAIFSMQFRALLNVKISILPVENHELRVEKHK